MNATNSIWTLIIVLSFITLEAIWSMVKKRKVYNAKDSLANVAIMVGSQLVKPMVLAWYFLFFSLLEPLQLFQLPNTWWTWVIAFLAIELVYYWYHRLSHEWPFLWTLHHTHHSSEYMNLTTAMRLNWLGGFFSAFAFVPLVLLGIEPAIIVSLQGISLVYQFFLHTEAVDKLGFLEGLLITTPSAHRVHHGSNEPYIDKNYGAILIIFDRLFGTYEAETEPVEYGVTTGSIGNNPFVINFKPMWQFLQGKFKREKEVLREEAVIDCRQRGIL
jgi:sterol desaturase/sphingolipid hydroxylase (fatty acid hydroxylase superfamily)